jgi:electron transport complex protein RnfG
MTGPGHSHGGGPPPAAPAASSSAGRLILTLGGAGAAAGALIVLAFTATQPRIEAHRAARLDAAVQEVLKAPARYDTLWVVDGGLVRQAPAGRDPAEDRVFHGFDAAGQPIGYAVVSAAPGFADVVRVIFGYDPATRKLLGMKVLESKETPGLGDKIIKDQGFVSEFDGVEAPILGVKPSDASGADNEVDMITGATISSRTVIRAINSSLERFGPMLDQYLATLGGARP